MSLLEEVKRLRQELGKVTDETDRILYQHRYSEMTAREAVLAFLADGKWWSRDDLRTALR